MNYVSRQGSDTDRFGKLDVLRCIRNKSLQQVINVTGVTGTSSVKGIISTFKPGWLQYPTEKEG